MNRLKGKVAVVTGASRGVGKGVALGLAEYGATVYVAGRTENDEGLPEFLKGTNIFSTAEAVSKAGGVGIAHRCDMTKNEQIKELFDRVQTEQNGHLDILVNSAWAGADHVMREYFWNTPFWEQPITLVDDFYSVGLRSNYIASQYAAKMMVQQGAGLIANISFYSARRYWINVSHGLFKAAVDKLSADTAYELKPHGVKVFSIYPGNVRTEGMIEAAKYNADMDVGKMETPQFAGRGIAEIAIDSGMIERSGCVLTTTDIANQYGFTDVSGKIPPSPKEELW